MLHQDPKRRKLGEWFLALISGKYKQGTGQLGTYEEGILSLCCLGVAAIIHQAKVQFTPYATGPSACEFLTWDSEGDVIADKHHMPLLISTSMGLPGSNPTVGPLCEHDRNLAAKYAMEWFNSQGSDYTVEYYKSSLGPSPSLATLNDNHVPFPVIAQFILRYL